MTNQDPIIEITVTRSAGADGALLVMIDTDPGQTGEEEMGRPLRILLNDEPVFHDVPFDGSEEDVRDAGSVKLTVHADQVAYQDDTATASFLTLRKPLQRGNTMNGNNLPDHGGRTVYENAERATESIIERAIRHDDQRQPNPDWDVRSEVYAKTVGRVERYMIAGNGPTEWVCFVFDEDGDLDHAYLHYVSSSDGAVVLLGQFDGEDLYKQMRSYR